MTAPRRAMALAAGLGTRMRPLTETRPKALIEVGGRSLLDHALDRLDAAGVERVVVNIHHLGDMLERHLASRRRPEISLSREKILLETGGGVVQALPSLGDRPFFVTSTDVVWIDGAMPALSRLAAAWDDARMDALLLVYPVEGALGYAGRGDFTMAADGRLERRAKDGDAPYLFTTVQMLHPRLFEGLEVSVFSLNVVYDRAIASGRLYGLVHDGIWAHVGTPEVLAAATALLEENR
jgi:MurNAc alpha-1-phosphate uridylyltransferase